MLQGRQAVQPLQHIRVGFEDRRARLVEKIAGPRTNRRELGAQVPVAVIRVRDAVLPQRVAVGTVHDGLLAGDLVVADEREGTVGSAGDVDDLDAFDRLRADAADIVNDDLGGAFGRAAPEGHRVGRGAVVAERPSA